MRGLVRRLALAAGISLAVACGGADAGPPITGPELAARLGGDDAPLVLDVRSPEEFAAGHVPGALNVPLRDLSGALERIEAAPAPEVVVYCERGVRAAAAAQLLRLAGVSQVRQLRGDMQDWRESGLPCEGC